MFQKWNFRKIWFPVIEIRNFDPSGFNFEPLKPRVASTESFSLKPLVFLSHFLVKNSELSKNRLVQYFILFGQILVKTTETTSAQQGDH